MCSMAQGTGDVKGQRRRWNINRLFSDGRASVESGGRGGAGTKVGERAPQRADLKTLGEKAAGGWKSLEEEEADMKSEADGRNKFTCFIVLSSCLRQSLTDQDGA